jgi:hypothetical protein
LWAAEMALLCGCNNTMITIERNNFVRMNVDTKGKVVDILLVGVPKQLDAS